MRKFIYLCILFLLPISVKAASVSVSLSCPSSVAANTQFTCDIKVNANGATVNGLSGNYKLSGVSYVSFTSKSGFAVYSSSANGFAVGNNSGVSGTFTIGTITLTSSNGGTIALSNLDASDTGLNSYAPSGPSASVRIKSTNNNLSSLSLSTGSLSPAFSSGVTSYTATVNAASVSINAVAADSNAKISGTGYKNLNYGNNTFNIVVTSEAGGTKTYKIVINRPDSRSTNNNLSSLTVSSGSISFNKNTTSYNLNVGSEVTSLKVGATLEDSKAIFVSGYGARTVNLNYGKNSIAIKVQAENGSVKTYTINVNREDNRSTNNNLKSLQIPGVSLPFDKEVLTYNVSVAYEKKEIEVVALAEDKKASVVVNNFPLAVGENTLSVVVTSENGVAKTYTIVVKRLSEAEKMSDNYNVSEMKIFGHEFEFKNDVTEYDITIGPDESELFFLITMEDDAAYFGIENNKDLKDGSVVKVIVYSESGLTKEYTFNIIAKEEQEKNNVMGYVLASVISLVIGAIIGFVVAKFIEKKKNSSKEEKKVEE